MRTWDDWGDFEISAAVAKAVGLKVSDNQYFEIPDRDERCVFVSRYSENDAVVDYCNNWSDMGPLIFDNNISLTTVGEMTWNADLITDIEDSDEIGQFLCFTGVTHQHTNPLRAAAIVFLEMMGVTP